MRGLKSTWDIFISLADYLKLDLVEKCFMSSYSVMNIVGNKERKNHTKKLGK